MQPVMGICLVHLQATIGSLMKPLCSICTGGEGSGLNFAASAANAKHHAYAGEAVAKLHRAVTLPGALSRRKTLLLWHPAGWRQSRAPRSAALAPRRATPRQRRISPENCCQERLGAEAFAPSCARALSALGPWRRSGVAAARCSLLQVAIRSLRGSLPCGLCQRAVRSSVDGR